MNISPLQVLPPQMCLCAVLAGIASFGVAGFAVWGWWLCVVGAAGSLRQPWHPFCLRKCCFIPTIHTGRDPGLMGVILSCWLPALEGGASILYQTSVSGSAVLQTWGAHRSTLTHWRPEHLVQGAVLVLLCFPWVPIHANSYLNT